MAANKCYLSLVKDRRDGIRDVDDTTRVTLYHKQEPVRCLQVTRCVSVNVYIDYLNTFSYIF